MTDATLGVEQFALLPTQLMQGPSYDSLPPEVRLALAVLEDAVMTLQATAGIDTARARRLAAQERMWILSDDLSHPFAFLNVCSYLGLDAAWLRSGILRLRLADGALRRVHRLRPNSRRFKPLSAIPPRAING